MTFNTRFFALIALFLLVMVEALASAQWVGEMREAYTTYSLPYFIAGLFIALIPLFKLPPIQQARLLSHRGFSYAMTGVKWSFFVYIAYQLLHFGRQIILAYPMDFKKADMMPIIQVMCQRFIDGKTIYEPISEIWKGVEPIYLPAMWAPFVPFEYIGADIRWGSVIAIIAGVALIFSVFSRLKEHTVWLILCFPPVFYLAEGIWAEQTFLIRFSEEGVVVFYYLLLGFALSRKNPYLTGLAIALCILSRYGLLFWVPVFLAFLWIYQSKKDALITATVALFIGVFAFLIPYGIQRFEFFISLPNEYPAFAKGLWEKHPDFFETTLGLAKFFSADSVDLQHKLHLSSIFFTPILMLLAFWQLQKRKIWEGAMWGICSLKLTLVFFYNLVIVPVLYLFWVPSFFSCILLAVYIKHSMEQQDEDKAVLA